MEITSPPPCPNTVTVRRNPPRRARPTPYSAVPLSLPPSSKTSSAIRSFPIQDILSIDIPEKQDSSQSTSLHESSDSEKLKVFLRIRPIVTQQKVAGSSKIGAQKSVWPQNPKKKDSLKTAKAGGKKTIESCLKVNDSRSVTLCPPQSLTDVRRTKSEVYEGFSHVFCDESSQTEVYERMMNPLVVDFLKGKSGMLAAMGPSGSGKTHTVFGSNRQPGMVSLALRHIFSQKDSCGSKCSRTFYLSMFEIYSERGKGEKIMDLSQEGGDLYMQQSNIKGLKEDVIHDAQQAESLVASGMLKRSTAMTNSNIQSSRSQCIINIRCDLNNLDEDQSCTPILTIVDLAGAEREKRTGNQGARLLESNFINNTSMVFGLCLRSLLEHQKNRKKPLHKHFQNSMLTRYLRDFLEGKKRMSLILTAKPGEEDYQDTSYLLRQASPFMNIKFESIEEQPLGNKRRTQALPKVELAKRMKHDNNGVCMDNEMKGGILHQPHKEEPDKEVKTSGSSQFSVTTDMKANKNKSTKESITDQAKKAREYQILSSFSRALWNVLKEYKNKLEASENEADSLRHNLTAEKERSAALEAQLNLMKASCSSGKVLMADENDKLYSILQVSSSPSIKIECIKKEQITTDTGTTFVTLLNDCSNTGNSENQAEEQVSCSNHCEEHVDTAVASSINDTSPVKAASTPLNAQSFEDQSIEKNYTSCKYVVFDKEDLMELGDTEFGSDIADYDTLEPGFSDSDLFLNGEEVLSLTTGDQKTPEKQEPIAQYSSSDISDSECFQKQNILDDTVTTDHEINTEEVKLKSGYHEKLEERSKEKVDVSSPNAVLDKQDFKETKERGTHGEITGCDDSKSAVCESELHVNGENSASFVKEDQQQHEEDLNACSSSSNPSESLCFEKQDILDSAGMSFIEVISISDDLEKIKEQSKEKNNVSSPNVLCDKQEFKEVEERDANGEVTVGDEVSSLEEVQPEQEEKEVNVPTTTSSDLEGSKSIRNTQCIVFTEAHDQQLVLPEDVTTSQRCNTSKLLEVPSVQPVQPFTLTKPKRRLRPASSVMLKNINILDFDDTTTMPKQQRNGKRGENEDRRKITPGSSSLLRILKQNLRH